MRKIASSSSSRPSIELDRFQTTRLGSVRVFVVETTWTYLHRGRHPTTAGRHRRQVQPCSVRVGAIHFPPQSSWLRSTTRTRTMQRAIPSPSDRHCRVQLLARSTFYPIISSFTTQAINRLEDCYGRGAVCLFVYSGNGCSSCFIIIQEVERC